jgi:4-hydroxybenzoyl-CoA thioesterase
MFRRLELIRFQHCDPAGIVFYPRYVEMINATVEDWFEHIGLSFADIHGPMATAIPVVSLHIDFQMPTRLGERLELQLIVDRIGTTSINLNVRAVLGEQSRFRSRLTLVHISKEDYRPRPWTKLFRDAMSTGVASSDQEA